MDGIGFLNETLNLVNTTLSPVVDEQSQSTKNIIYAYGFFYTFIVPFICLFGIITNILNIIVFSNNKLKDESYKYLKMNAFSNMFYLSFIVIAFVKRCTNFCDYETTLFANVYYWAFYFYLKGILFLLV